MCKQPSPYKVGSSITLPPKVYDVDIGITLCVHLICKISDKLKNSTAFHSYRKESQRDVAGIAQKECPGMFCEKHFSFFSPIELNNMNVRSEGFQGLSSLGPQLVKSYPDSLDSFLQVSESYS